MKPHLIPYPVPSKIQWQFWQKVKPRGPAHCWPMTTKEGLPYQDRSNVAWRAEKAGATVQAGWSWISWMLHRGPIPKADGLMMCHHCDYPPCVNPAHLYLGDAGTNVRDQSRGDDLICLESIRSRMSALDERCQVWATWTEAQREMQLGLMNQTAFRQWDAMRRGKPEPFLRSEMRDTGEGLVYDPALTGGLLLERSR